MTTTKGGRRFGSARMLSNVKGDVELSLRLFQLNWIIIGVVLVLLALGVLLTSFRMEPKGYIVILGMTGLYGYIGHRNARSGRGNPRVYATLFTLAQIILILILVTSLGYIAASAALPMQEARLLAFDRALGLDFRAYLSFVNDRPGLIRALAPTYNSIFVQLAVLVVLLPLCGFYRRAAEFVLCFALTLIVTTVISTLVPATGVYHALGLLPADHPNIEPSVYYDTLRELPLVRDGTTRVLDAFSLGPLLTFPSFHAITAVLYAWALWPIGWLRVAGTLWNAVVLAATPIGGGHFFVDVIAGVGIAFATIYATHRLGNYFARGQSQKQQPVLVPSHASANRI
ncbi:phosphatase PAP2 family protein [Bradyrhizobium daqingense]|uniref:PAP2 superfamily protein n=1 Tax=Bradyrhizobium daqingense TaxID=993502 RepID=A0A562KUH8_9BRAD|nr:MULTISPECIES: phosphatase PAP2 family protein [Bradyrhizobium]MDQ8731247.1 phosphatase PAP2 family protein [Bradyrhizobium sp. LHD-71]TWH99017.1 PAP2 superfamily protein [Bradyrhizobium daqingense]UFS90720.1 phosphatase PAP2 family protein [Bradyrhizobium daqingense]